MMRGRRPLTTITANKNPHKRNHLLARLDIVVKTSALITALSMEVIISKSERPKTVSKIVINNIYKLDFIRYYAWLPEDYF